MKPAALAVAAISIATFPALLPAGSVAAAGSDRELATVEVTFPVAPAPTDGASGTDGPASCGGTAPIETTCAAGGTLVCCSVIFGVSVKLGCASCVVTNAGGTATAAWSVACEWIVGGATPPTCDRDLTGTLQAGQAYAFRGESDEWSIGEWTAFVTN